LFVIYFCLVNCDEEVYQWDADIYPNLTSHKNAKFCTGAKRNPPSSVCDPDQVLHKHEAIKLDQLINEINNNTKCVCDRCPPHRPGFNIKVALIKHIKLSRNISLDRTVEMFAERTRRRWHYGDDCSNDILIFVAALDDRVYISMGLRARQVISEEEEKKVKDETKQHFTSGYYYQGLESIIASFQDINQNWDPSKSSKMGLGSILLIVVCVTTLVIIILSLIVWFCIKRDKNSLSNSFEFIGSWGRNRGKHKPQPKAKSEPIYRPVKTAEKPDFDNDNSSTLPMKTRDPIA